MDSKTNEEYFAVAVEDHLAGRARGLSYWHWVYYLNHQGFGFYNTRAQALEARVRASAR